VPPKQHDVGRHERGDLAQQPAPQAVAECCEAPTPVVLETQPPSRKTDLQHTILFAKKRDHVLEFMLAPRAPALPRTVFFDQDEVQPKVATRAIGSHPAKQMSRRPAGI
jgi:hypothetical protein